MQVFVHLEGTLFCGLDALASKVKRVSLLRSIHFVSTFWEQQRLRQVQGHCYDRLFLPLKVMTSALPV